MDHNPDTPLHTKQAHAILSAALHSLPPAQERLVRMLKLEGHAMRNVMEKSGLTRREVCVIVEDSLCQLRRLLESLGLALRHLLD